MKEASAEGLGIRHPPPPLVYFAAFLVGLGLNTLYPFTIAGALIIVVVGAVIFLAGVAIGFMSRSAMRRAGTSPNPTKPTRAIVTDGPFQMSRNPLYLSLTLVYFGIAIAFGNIWCLIFLVPTLIIMDRIVIPHEEAYLERRFGNQYLEYKSKVRRWL